MSTRALLPRGPARLARVRAALIALLVFFNVLAALPTLGTPSAERLERPYEQAELRRWAGLCAAFGIQVTPERLAELYLELVGGFAQLRELALAPVDGWMQLTQTTQRWSLFGTPDEERNRLRISASLPEGDRLLYETQNPERRWHASLLEYRRIRAAYNPSRRGPPPTYAGLCQRLAELVFAELPEARGVRCAFDRSRIALPGEAPDPRHEEVEVLELARPAP
jgi:hypothetical protein